MAHYISLEESPKIWAEKIIESVSINMNCRRSYASEVLKTGFDSQNEALRLQKFYIDAISSTSN